jgi:hypothetical protein
MTKRELIQILNDIPDDFEVTIKTQDHSLDAFEWGFPHMVEHDITISYDVAHSDKKIVLFAKEID